MRQTLLVLFLLQASLVAQTPPVVLKAARMLDVETGRITSPAEILVRDGLIAELGTSTSHPVGAETLDLGDTTLLPGLIDTHVHLFLHPGAQDQQTLSESVPQRTILATIAAREHLMAGFTAERDMGTEGAGSADTAVRNAINKGLPGPRLRISGNTVDILGGHEDAIGYNPDQHVIANATYANSAAELVTVLRQQFKEGADFGKIYETGRDTVANGRVSSPYQFTEAELTLAVTEAARTGRKIAVHASTDPGALFAARAGVASIDHAEQLSAETMRLMKEKRIFVVPTFAVLDYFVTHAATKEHAAARQRMIDVHAAEFPKQLAAGVPVAMGSDVGPFPHGTQAREFTLMVKYGMTPLQVIQAGTLNGAELLGWRDSLGVLKTGYFADIVAVPGNPLSDITVLEKVKFVMKAGVVYRRP